MRPPLRRPVPLRLADAVMSPAPDSAADLSGVLAQVNAECGAAGGASLPAQEGMASPSREAEALLALRPLNFAPDSVSALGSADVLDNDVAQAWVARSRTEAAPSNAATGALRFLPRSLSPEPPGFAALPYGRPGASLPRATAAAPRPGLGVPPPAAAPASAATAAAADALPLPPGAATANAFAALGDFTRLRAVLDWQRLIDMVPPALFPIAGLVPGAWATVQNTRIGWQRWQQVRALTRASAHEQPSELPSVMQFRFVRRCALARAAGEAGLFLGFTVVEQLSWLLSATSVALRLVLGTAPLPAAFGHLFAHAAPGLMALHGALHMWRHVMALRQVTRARAQSGLLLERAGLIARDERSLALSLAPMPPAWRRDTAAGHLRLLYTEAGKEQRQRAYWLLAWAAFEVGLLLGSALLSHGLPPLWAFVWLALSVCATKVLELLFGAEHEPPLMLLWPLEGKASLVPTPLQSRAFGSLKVQAQAAQCLTAQEAAWQAGLDEVAGYLSRWRRVLLPVAFGLRGLPYGERACSRLCRLLCEQQVDRAAAPLLAAHVGVWQAQARLLAAEVQQADAHPEAWGAGAVAAKRSEYQALDHTLRQLGRGPAALATPSAQTSPPAGSGAWPEARVDLGPAAAKALARRWTRPDEQAGRAIAWQLMLRTWGLAGGQGAAPCHASPGLQAEALGALMVVPANNMRAARQALTWGGHVSLAAKLRGPTPWHSLVTRA